MWDQHCGMKPFRVAVARAAGVPDAVIRSRRLEAPFHGVRAAHGVDKDVVALARAYAVKMRRDAAFSHVTGAQLLGLPLPVRFTPSPLHVSVPTGTAPVRGRGVVGHHLASTSRSLEVRGLRVLQPAALWVTLGLALEVPDLVAAADSLVTSTSSQRALCSVDDLQVALAESPRARRRGVLRAALPFVRVGAASRPESLLRVLLQAAGFPEPELNFRVEGLRYLVDLAWPDFRFGIEYDGGHHRSAAQYGADLRRQEVIHDDDWLLMHVQKEDLFGDPLGVVTRARLRLARLGFVVPHREVSQTVLPRP